MDDNPLFMLDGAAGGREGSGDSVLNVLLARGAEAESGSAGRLGGASGADATPLLAALDLHPAQAAGTAPGGGITSCSATDWRALAVLDGGPGGSDAPMDLREGSDTESSAWVSCFFCTWWEIICRSKLARSREIWKLARSRENRRYSTARKVLHQRRGAR